MKISDTSEVDKEQAIIMVSALNAIFKDQPSDSEG